MNLIEKIKGMMKKKEEADEADEEIDVLDRIVDVNKLMKISHETEAIIDEIKTMLRMKQKIKKDYNKGGITTEVYSALGDEYADEIEALRKNAKNKVKDLDKMGSEIKKLAKEYKKLLKD